MTAASMRIRWPLLAAVAAILALMLALAFVRLQVDMDVAASLPTGDRVVADAVHLFRHHPIKDQIAVDIGLAQPDRRRLAAAARQVEAALSESGLFARVGLADFQEFLPALVTHVARHLPSLFTADDLQNDVLPRLSGERIAQQMDRLLDQLHGLEAIGQARELSRDPLGLGRILLARLALLAPTDRGAVEAGRLVSADGRHLLIPATPRGSGTDTDFARRLTRLIADLSADLNAGARSAPPVTLTAVGAFRAALDNETIVRRDVNNAIVWATAGIAVMLMLAFSRPLIGLLALMPALAGTAAALVVFALLEGRISVMVLGFGGAVISISVDHGIAYLLFLDCPGETDGRLAAHEIRAVGLLAVLTTVGAFGVLSFSAFPVFAQLGRFTALGIGAAFVFVHTVFARLFRRRAPDAPDRAAGAPARRLLARLVDRLAALGPWGAVAAGVLMIVLAGFVQVRLDTDLERMNSISEATRQADATMARVWGSLFGRVYLMIEADDPATLQQRGDALMASLEAEAAAGRVAAGVTAATFFPGPSRQASNRKAWAAFWTAGRVAALHRDLTAAAEARGFRPGAFAPFFRRLSAPNAGAVPVPGSMGALLGLSRDRESGRWRQVSAVVPGPHYAAADLFSRLGTDVFIFDPAFFSQRLGRLLADTFRRMLAVIGGCMVALLLIFLADPMLTAIALLPLVFAAVCTLGTLGLLGRPLDIPALMLGPVILGLGVDYALLMASAFQRYQRLDHPLFTQVRTAIVMAAGSTLIGFGVLATAEHGVLQSVGITSLLGIGYCLLGAFLIVPPLLGRRFKPPGTGPLTVGARYRNLEAYPRMFARFKLRLDPMFAELDRLLPDGFAPETVIDIGCGYGVPASWLLERHPAAIVHGIEPAGDRVRVARLALGGNGVIVQGCAPQVPSPPDAADLGMMLDMNHYLDDEALGLTLGRLHRRLAADGRLVMRSVLVPPGRGTWAWWRENVRLKRLGLGVWYRPVEQIGRMLERSGFALEWTGFSGNRQDLYWTVARPLPAAERAVASAMDLR